MDAPLEGRWSFPLEVANPHLHVIVEIAPEVMRLFVEALRGYEGLHYQAYPALFIDFDDAQAAPFVEYGARADVLAHGGDQLVE